jgi:hypothetical protein
MIEESRIREPGSTGFWLLIALLVLLCVPYLFMGASEPRLLGLPIWFYLSLGAAIAIAVASVRRIMKHWDIEKRLP